MPMMPGMTVAPRRSNTFVSGEGNSSAPFAIAVMIPCSIVMFWSARAAAPVPSTISTCSSTTRVVVGRTYLITRPAQEGFNTLRQSHRRRKHQESE